MVNFTHYLPTKFVFGRGVENQVGEEVKKLAATKVLIHYGGGSAVRSGLIARVENSLDAAGIAHVSLGGAMPNPRDTKVYEGIELIRGKRWISCWPWVVARPSIRPRPWPSARSMMGISGFLFRKGRPEKSLPKGVVLTMAAAGSESSNSSVISRNPRR